MILLLLAILNLQKYYAEVKIIEDADVVAKSESCGEPYHAIPYATKQISSQR